MKKNDYNEIEEKSQMINWDEIRKEVIKRSGIINNIDKLLFDIAGDIITDNMTDKKYRRYDEKLQDLGFGGFEIIGDSWQKTRL
jgi:hypothetical protein